VRRERDLRSRGGDASPCARTRAIVENRLSALCRGVDSGTLLADDVALTVMGTGEVTHGRAAVIALLDRLHRRAFTAPPVVRAMIADQGRAMVEAEFVGAHAGEFAGIAPTGRQVRVAYAAAYDLQGGAIVALRLYLPLDALVRQLRDP
jgi:predicted ester cyclase